MAEAEPGPGPDFAFVEGKGGATRSAAASARAMDPGALAALETSGSGWARCSSAEECAIPEPVLGNRQDLSRYGATGSFAWLATARWPLGGLDFYWVLHATHTAWQIGSSSCVFLGSDK